MTLAHAAKRHGPVVHEVLKKLAVQVQAALRFTWQSIDDIIAAGYQ